MLDFPNQFFYLQLWILHIEIFIQKNFGYKYFLNVHLTFYPQSNNLHEFQIVYPGVKFRKFHSRGSISQLDYLLATSLKIIYYILFCKGDHSLKNNRLCKFSHLFFYIYSKILRQTDKELHYQRKDLHVLIFFKCFNNMV